MANEKTWQDKCNIPMTTSSLADQKRNIVWAFKAFLKGDAGISGAPASGLWTCYYSCDGTDAGTANDGVDRWGTTFDASKLVFDTYGSAHSWFVLKSPNNVGGLTGNGPYYIIFDYVGTYDYRMNIYASKNAPTGGTVTARPTATDEWTVATSAQFHDDYGSQNWRVHGFLTTDGMFALFSSKVKQGQVYYSFLGQSLADASSADAYNFWTYAASSNTGLEISVMQTIGWIGRSHDGTNIQVSRPLAYYDGSEYPHTNLVFRRSDQKMTSLPVYMYTRDAGHRDQRGRLFDLTMGPNALPSGTLVPDSVSPTHVLINNFWIPCTEVIVF